MKLDSIRLDYCHSTPLKFISKLFAMAASQSIGNLTKITTSFDDNLDAGLICPRFVHYAAVEFAFVLFMTNNIVLNFCTDWEGYPYCKVTHSRSAETWR